MNNFFFLIILTNSLKIDPCHAIAGIFKPDEKSGSNNCDVNNQSNGLNNTVPGNIDCNLVCKPQQNQVMYVQQPCICTPPQPQPQPQPTTIVQPVIVKQVEQKYIEQPKKFHKKIHRVKNAKSDSWKKWWETEKTVPGFNISNIHDNQALRKCTYLLRKKANLNFVIKKLKSSLKDNDESSSKSDGNEDELELCMSEMSAIGPNKWKSAWECQIYDDADLKGMLKRAKNGVSAKALSPKEIPENELSSKEIPENEIEDERNSDSSASSSSSDESFMDKIKRHGNNIKDKVKSTGNRLKEKAMDFGGKLKSLFF